MRETVQCRAKNPAKAIRAISLFSGCGGSDLALKDLGFQMMWANDLSEVACKTYEDNLGPVAKQGDIADFSQFPSAQFMVGCYPCQGFTQGGRRKSGDSINFLYQQFDRVLRIVLPKAFVVENVNGMAYGENRTLLNNQLTRYRSAGYRVGWQVLDARNYGVAQQRRRVFIVGVRSDIDFEYKFPHAQTGADSGIPFVTQGDVLKGMPEWPVGDFNEEAFHWYYLSRNRRHDWDEPSPCVVGHWRHVPLHPMSPPLRRIHTDKWVFAAAGKARRFAYKECAALQGFPRTFQWQRGSIRDRFQMIGNAVPPPLFRAVVAPLRGVWS